MSYLVLLLVSAIGIILYALYTGEFYLAFSIFAILLISATQNLIKFMISVNYFKKIYVLLFFSVPLLPLVFTYLILRKTEIFLKISDNEVWALISVHVLLFYIFVYSGIAAIYREVKGKYADYIIENGIQRPILLELMEFSFFFISTIAKSSSSKADYKGGKWSGSGGKSAGGGASDGF